MEEPQSETTIPRHYGVHYQDFMSELSRKRDTRRYLEVGVQEGILLSKIHSEVAVGVDPQFIVSANIALNKRRCILIQESSDRFFREPELVNLLGGPPELSFLDGFHTFEFLLRDFMNTEAIGTTSSLIAMHDCLPLDGVMAIRNFDDWRHATVGSTYEGAWTGDVWKVIPALKKYRPDLTLAYLDCPPTGVVCITNLDPSSTVLHDNYMEIVSEYLPIPNTESSISNLYGDIQITNSLDVLREFDHTLYFRC